MQFVFVLFDATSLCLHSGEQTVSGMLAHSSCLEYGKLHGSVFAMIFARSNL